MPTKQVVKFVQDTHCILKEQSDLSPKNNLVNSTLTDLVKCLSQCHLSGIGEILAENEDLSHARQHLPKLCGFAEGEMERYWARHFVNKPSLTSEDLKEFWYYNNYIALWDLEQHLIGPLQNNQFIFLGSGPLPLTAIVAALKNPDLKINCIDYDSEACNLSQQLVDKVGLSKRITITESSAFDYAYNPDDFVVCASLITEKDKLYKQLHKSGVTDFIVRDAESSYCYLYAPSQLPQTSDYRELRRTIPNKMCINTTRYFSKAA